MSKPEASKESESATNHYEQATTDHEEFVEQCDSDDLESLNRKLQESEDKILRMAADFDNTRKRLAREKEVLLKYAEENLLRELLPGMDNLERAMEQARETGNLEGLLEGLEMTRAGLLETLEKFGVKQVSCIGEPFDPNFHEALAMEPSSSIAANHVMMEYQKGYAYKDRLLRAAKVIVSKGE